MEQIRTIDKKRLREKVCSTDNELLKLVNKALIVSLGIAE